MNLAQGHSRPATDTVNIAERLVASAERYPDKRAIVWTAGRDAAGTATYGHVTFAELNRETDRFAHGFDRAGITRGTRTILFVKPGVEFFTAVFALFKVGAVPVMIDPGIGKQQMRLCLSEVDAEAFIGTPLAHVFRKLYPTAFKRISTAVTVGRRWGWGGLRWEDLRTEPWQPYTTAETRADDPAAILFTSGSTGPAKGVLYEHGVFDTQVRYLNSQFGYSPDEIDLPTFPLFALFDAALGMTAVIPDMDFTKPGSVDPRKIVEPIADHNVTHMFGSPALLDRLSQYGRANGITLPTVKRVMTAGAPVPPAVLERMQAMLPVGGEIHTPYGATEALPVATIGSREILSETRSITSRGGGTCVGRPIPGLDVRVIAIDDEPIPKWHYGLESPQGTNGEIVVKGPVVTRQYYNRPEATRLAKIRDGDSIWHRMGDVGYFDERGRLWFCGRKAHRVTAEDETFFSVPCEAIFNEHPNVYRSALVGVGRPGRQTPVICVQENEREKGRRGEETKGRRGWGDRELLTQQLLQLAEANELTRSIKTVLYHPSFPVDVRHNSKIFREKLAVWAAGKLR